MLCESSKAEPVPESKQLVIYKWVAGVLTSILIGGIAAAFTFGATQATKIYQIEQNARDIKTLNAWREKDHALLLEIRGDVRAILRNNRHQETNRD